MVAGGIPEDSSGDGQAIALAAGCLKSTLDRLMARWPTSLMISNLSAAQFRHAADIQDKIETLQGQLSSLLGGGSGVGNGIAKRRGRPPGGSKKGNRTMSAAGRAKIAAAARLRWKKAKAAGRNSL
jgi:hypothetical protein